MLDCKWIYQCHLSLKFFRSAYHWWNLGLWTRCIDLKFQQNMVTFLRILFHLEIAEQFGLTICNWRLNRKFSFVRFLKKVWLILTNLRISKHPSEIRKEHIVTADIVYLICMKLESILNKIIDFNRVHLAWTVRNLT